MTRKARHIHPADWGDATGLWKGHVEGRDLDTGVTVLFFSTESVGHGPVWHVHPYDEVFVIRKGRARFTIGDQKIDADEGDILMGPAEVPHKYENLGPGPLETTDVHLSDHWNQTDLDDPELA